MGKGKPMKYVNKTGKTIHMHRQDYENMAVFLTVLQIELASLWLNQLNE